MFPVSSLNILPTTGSAGIDCEISSIPNYFSTLLILTIYPVASKTGLKETEIILFPKSDTVNLVGVIIGYPTLEL